MAGYTPSHTYWDPVKRMMVTTPATGPSTQSSLGTPTAAPPGWSVPGGPQYTPPPNPPTPGWGWSVPGGWRPPTPPPDWFTRGGPPPGWSVPGGAQYPPPTGGFTGGMNLPALNVPAGLSGTLSSALSGLASSGGGGTGITPGGFPTSGYRPPGMAASRFPGQAPPTEPTAAPVGTPPAGYRWSWVENRWILVPITSSTPPDFQPAPTQAAPAGYRYERDPFTGTWRLVRTGEPGPTMTGTAGGGTVTGGPSGPASPQESQRALLELQASLARQATAQQGTQQMELARLQAQNERGLTQLGQTGAMDLARLDAETRARLLGKEQAFGGEQAGLERTFTGEQSALARAQELERLQREQQFTGGQSELERALTREQSELERAQELERLGREQTFGAGEAEKERAGALSFLQEQSRLKGVGGERTIAALRELMGLGTPPPPLGPSATGPLGADTLGTSLSGGITTPLTPLGLTPGEPTPMDVASDQAIWGRAKERVGGTLEGALKGLTDIASSRGIAGSGIEGQMISDVMGRGVGELGEVSREQAIQDLLAKRRASELNQQYLLARRGQDIDVRAQDMARQNALITALLSGNLF